MLSCVIDSSVWIDFFNNKMSTKIEKAKDLIKESFKKTEIIILPVIMQEVLQGIRDDKFYRVVKAHLFAFSLMEYDSFELALSAADLYRSLKNNGITIRKANDCLIAAICIQKNCFILHNDKDFDNIAKHTSLKIYK